MNRANASAFVFAEVEPLACKVARKLAAGLGIFLLAVGAGAGLLQSDEASLDEVDEACMLVALHGSSK